MNDASKTPSQQAAPVPSHLPLELLPLYDWWKANGSRLLTVAATAAIVFSATVIALRVHSGRKTEAMLAATNARSLDELEGVVSRYGRTPAGIAARLRLARAYCDAGRFEEALAAYEAFERRHPSHPFVDVAKVGRGQALEGLNRAAEAAELFRAFRRDHPDHYLAPTAWLAEARCLALQQRKDDAKALLDELQTVKAGTPWEAMAKQLQGVIARYDGRSLAPATLFDQAGLLPFLPPAEGAGTNLPAPPPQP